MSRPVLVLLLLLNSVAGVAAQGDGGTQRETREQIYAVMREEWRRGYCGYFDPRALDLSAYTGQAGTDRAPSDRCPPL